MKNNRLTNQELYAIRESVKEIKRLVSMETTSFSFDAEKDERIKKTIRPWLMWFEGEAYKIGEIVGCDDDD